MSTHIRLDPILCDGHGQCAELLPERIDLDEWGYPIVSDEALPSFLTAEAERTIALCPRFALSIERRRAADAAGAVR